MSLSAGTPPRRTDSPRTQVVPHCEKETKKVWNGAMVVVGWGGTRPLAPVAGCYGVGGGRAVEYSMERGGGSEVGDPNAGQRVPIFVSTLQTAILTTASDTEFKYFGYDPLRFERYLFLYILSSGTVGSCNGYCIFICVGVLWTGHVFRCRSCR